MAKPFHLSARNIRLEDGHFLLAELEDEAGNFHDAAIDLDTCLGNNNGHFQWGGHSLSLSASNIRLAFEGDGNIPVLLADLRHSDGVNSGSSINLTQRISGENARFVFLE